MTIFQERTRDEHQKLVQRIVKRDQARQKKIKAAGIDYECPEIVRIFFFPEVYEILAKP